MDLDFSPNILHTPSLMTPNINANPPMYNPLYAASINHDDTTATMPSNNSSSNPSSITTNSDESMSGSSGEIKLSKIEDDLRLSVTQPRKPTQSPFQQMVTGGAMTIGKTTLMPSTTGDDTPADIPSTAEVMNDLESFGKYPTKDNGDRESHRFDTSPTHNMVLNVSPKKKLLARSQSRTDVVSPTNSKSNLDEDTPVDDGPIVNHFQRVHEISLAAHPVEGNPQMRIDQNGTHPVIIKQQPMIPSPKRTLQQAFIGTPIPKLSAVVLTHPSTINEVTSSNQLSGVKRPKLSHLAPETSTLRVAAYPSSSISDNNNNAFGSDDPRKKQIRDSNREAARRCRERRRQYIEKLEGDLDQCKAQIKQLADKISRVERENTQLHAIITEAKIFQASSSSRLPSNEAITDFANAMATGNGLTLHSESTDGNVIHRTYLNRATH